MPKHHPFRTAGIVGLLSLSVVAATSPVDQASAVPQQPADQRASEPDRTGGYDTKTARAAARSIVATKRSALKVSAKDTLAISEGTTAMGLQHIRYSVTHRGVPVVGAGVVVTTDADGKVLGTTVAHEAPVAVTDVTPKLSRSAALHEAGATSAAKRDAASGDKGGVLGDDPETRLVILSHGKKSSLAWEVTTAMAQKYVDARTGKVLRTIEAAEVDGHGYTAYSGPSPRPIDVWERYPGKFYMAGYRPYLKCETGTFYVVNGSDVAYSSKSFPWASKPAFGNGDGTRKWNGCVDALYGAQRFEAMITSWLGRNGTQGNGRGIPHYVGLNETNAYASPKGFNVYGSDLGGRWMTSVDIVGHESGHQIDYRTGGGASHPTTREFVADAFGTATEEFDNQPAPYDVPDMTIGEQLKLRADGQPARTMAKMPRNCYTNLDTSSSHAAAAAGDLWFVLASEGSKGKSDALACDGTDPQIEGLGTKAVLQILYTGMLSKPAHANYKHYRTQTLNAAKHLNPGDCAPFKTVQAAWNAVKVPATTTETCTA